MAYSPPKAEGLLANGIGWIVTLQENPGIRLSAHNLFTFSL